MPGLKVMIRMATDATPTPLLYSAVMKPTTKGSGDLLQIVAFDIQQPVVFAHDDVIPRDPCRVHRLLYDFLRDLSDDFVV
jgi:hypothetical protein